jgi:type I restriction enzyme S subunit
VKISTVKLGDICEINPSTNFVFDSEDACSFVPMEAVDDVDARIMRMATRPFHEVAKGYTPFVENDVIVAKITPCMENGKCAIGRRLRSPVAFGSTEFHVLRAMKGVIPEWLFYFWRFPPTRHLASVNMTGSAGQKRVPVTFLESAEIPLPGLSEQRRIADRLQAADRLRRTRRYALELIDTFLTAAFIDIFGDPLQNTRCYKVEELGDLLLIPPGLGTTKPCEPDGALRCIRVGEVGFGDIDLEACGFVNLTESERSRFMAEAGDILLARAIGSEEHLGKLSICRPHAGILAFDSHLMRLRVDPSRLLPQFLGSMLWSSGGRRLFMRQARRTAVQFNVNAEQISNLPIPLPPLPEQHHFVTLVGRAERLRSVQRESLRQADHLFASLLDRAFRGHTAE